MREDFFGCCCTMNNAPGKHRLFVLCCFILIGYMECTALAWFLVVRESTKIVQYQMGIPGDHSASLKRDLRWPRTPPPGWSLPVSEVKHSSGFGIEVIVAVAQTPDTPVHNGIQYIDASVTKMTVTYAGWPWLSTLMERQEEYYWMEPERNTDTWRYVAPFTYTPKSRLTASHFPVLPVWPGTLFNSLLFGMCSWMLVHVPRLVRRYIRQHHGRCPVCGYDMNNLKTSVCPECGSNHV
jgi:hypothetical protein